jgi:hypothetical protein
MAKFMEKGSGGATHSSGSTPYQGGGRFGAPSAGKEYKINKQSKLRAAIIRRNAARGKK